MISCMLTGLGDWFAGDGIDDWFKREGLNVIKGGGALKQKTIS